MGDPVTDAIASDPALSPARSNVGNDLLSGGPGDDTLNGGDDNNATNDSCFPEGFPFSFGIPVNPHSTPILRRPVTQPK